MIAAAWILAAGLAADLKPPFPVPRPARPLLSVPMPIPRPARPQPGQVLLSGVTQSTQGALCQDPRLSGRVLTEITAPGACGVVAPVRVSQVSGIPLSTPATVNCQTARRFADWLEGVAAPAVEQELGAKIQGVWVMASYACRTRNHQPGARISEHGKGRAIDIGGLTLSTGGRITVADDWGKGAPGRALSRMHRGSCGLFKTVLGPEADVHHKNHFHFDTSQRVGGAYCR